MTHDIASNGRPRLPAAVWHLERMFGPKVPQCLWCGSHDLYEDHANASWKCGGCKRALTAEHGVRFVPADPSARNPDEEHLPSGRWLRDLERATGSR